jgi:hypothetical protein
MIPVAWTKTSLSHTMTDRRDPENVEVEMLEDGPLLGDEDTQKKDFQQRSLLKRRNLTEWVIWSVLIIFCIIALLDNIRLRQRPSCTSAFSTDLSKSGSMTINKSFSRC